MCTAKRNDLSKIQNLTIMSIEDKYPEAVEAYNEWIKDIESAAMEGKDIVLLMVKEEDLVYGMTVRLLKLEGFKVKVMEHFNGFAKVIVEW